VKTRAEVLFEVTLAWRILVHYAVAEDAIEERMEEMGMGAHWRALAANDLPPPYLDLVPRRDPNDERCVDLM
jgi:hypothetical protein